MPVSNAPLFRCASKVWIALFFYMAFFLFFVAASCVARFCVDFINNSFRGKSKLSPRNKKVKVVVKLFRSLHRYVVFVRRKSESDSENQKSENWEH